MQVLQHAPISITSLDLTLPGAETWLGIASTRLPALRDLRVTVSTPTAAIGRMAGLERLTLVTTQVHPRTPALTMDVHSSKLEFCMRGKYRVKSRRAV